MSVRAVLLDLDGTLWHAPAEPTEERTRRLNAVRTARARDFLAREGWPEIDAVALVETALALVDDTLDLGRLAANGYRVPDRMTVAHEALGRFIKGATDEQAGAFSDLLRISYPDWPVALFPDTIATLERLRQTVPSLVLVTNNVEATVLRPELDYFGVGQYLDGVVCSLDVGYSKPGFALFEAALGVAGVPAPDAVMVGDSFDMDVVGARSAGIRAVLKTNGRPTRDRERQGADYVISELSELMGLGLFA